MDEIILDILQHRAATNPHGLAFDFNVSSGIVDRITYKELDNAARGAALFLSNIAAKGKPVILLHPPGLDFLVDLFGCLYAGAIAVPCPPAYHNTQRINTLLQFLKPAILLTSTSDQERQYSALKRIFSGDNITLHANDRCGDSSYVPSRPKLADTAIIQFTSGSISTPRGSVVTHGNIAANLRQIHRAFDFRTDLRTEGVALWLPHFHDMGLFSRLQSIYTGCPCYLMSPTEFARNPIRWLQLISEKQATVSGGPNSAFAACSQSLSRAPDGLDLSSWRLAFCGSEPVQHNTMVEFCNTFRRFGLTKKAVLPCYGMAEATLLISCGIPGEAYATADLDVDAFAAGKVKLSDGGRSRTFVACGTCPPEMEVITANPENLTKIGSGEIGEVWISGPNVVPCYWNSDQTWDKSFEVEPEGQTDGRTYFRTGDLGFFLNGELYITGRRKELIIINGSNFYAHDIEIVLRQSHASLKNSRAAAFSIEENTGERLVLLFEMPSPRFAGSDSVENIISHIYTHMSQALGISPAEVVAIKKGTIEITSSGKIARRKCEEAFRAGRLTIVASSKSPRRQDSLTSARNPIGIVLEQLLEQPLIDASLPLSEQVLDSLKAMRFLAQVNQRFGVTIDPTQVQKCTFADLEQMIDELILEKLQKMSEEDARKFSVESKVNYGR